MHSLMNLTVFIVNLSTLCSYLCILHLKWCVYQFIIIIIIGHARREFQLGIHGYRVWLRLVRF